MIIDISLYVTTLGQDLIADIGDVLIFIIYSVTCLSNSNHIKFRKQLDTWLWALTYLLVYVYPGYNVRLPSLLMQKSLRHHFCQRICDLHVLTVDFADINTFLLLFVQISPFLQPRIPQHNQGVQVIHHQHLIWHKYLKTAFRIALVPPLHRRSILQKVTTEMR